MFSLSKTHQKTSEPEFSFSPRNQWKIPLFFSMSSSFLNGFLISLNTCPLESKIFLLKNQNPHSFLFLCRICPDHLSQNVDWILSSQNPPCWILTYPKCLLYIEGSALCSSFCQPNSSKPCLMAVVYNLGYRNPEYISEPKPVGQQQS